MEGRCDYGDDCRFSHPGHGKFPRSCWCLPWPFSKYLWCISSLDDAKPAHTSEYVEWTGFGMHYDLCSPPLASSIYVNVSPSDHSNFNPSAIPPTIVIDDPPRRRTKKSVSRKLTIAPPQLESSSGDHSTSYSAHKFLDGNTLLARPLDVGGASIGAAVPEDVSGVSGTSTLDVSVDTRTLVRPVSTPPTPMRNNMEVVRVCFFMFLNSRQHANSTISILALCRRSTISTYITS